MGTSLGAVSGGACARHRPAPPAERIRPSLAHGSLVGAGGAGQSERGNGVAWVRSAGVVSASERVVDDRTDRAEGVGSGRAVEREQ